MLLLAYWIEFDAVTFTSPSSEKKKIAKCTWLVPCDPKCFRALLSTRDILPSILLSVMWAISTHYATKGTKKMVGG